MSVQGIGAGAFPFPVAAAQAQPNPLNAILNPLDPAVINLNASQFQNPQSSINQPWMTMALAPTLAGITGTNQQFIGNDWMQSVREFAAGIANGVIPVSSTQIPGISGLSGMGGGTNAIALRYLMKSLGKKDPDSPEAQKLEEIILKVGGNTPEVKSMLLEAKLQNFDNFSIQLATIRQSFPPGSQEASFIDARVQALQARKSNTLFEALLLQTLGDNPQDLRARFIREAIGLYSNPDNQDPVSLAALENRIIMLTQGTPLAGQLIHAARTVRQNNIAIRNFDTQVKPPEGITVGNPLEAMLGSLGFLLSGGNAAFGGNILNSPQGGGLNPANLLGALSALTGGGNGGQNPLAGLLGALAGQGNAPRNEGQPANAFRSTLFD